MKMTVIPIVNVALGTVTKTNKRTSRDNPNSSIVEFGQNTEKNPGD